MAILGSNLTFGINSADQTSYASASITPTANNLILATVANRVGSGTPNQPTASGNGLTWVVEKSLVFDDTGSQRRVTVFRAMGASPSAGAVTFAFASQTQTDCVWSIDQFSGIDTSGTNGSGAIVQSVSNTTTLGGGVVSSLTVTLAAFSNVNNATFGGFGSGGLASDLTVGTGFTLLNTGFDELSDGLSVLSEWKTANDTTVNCNAPNNTEFGGIAIELKIAVVKDMIQAGIIPFLR